MLMRHGALLLAKICLAAAFRPSLLVRGNASAVAPGLFTHDRFGARAVVGPV